MSFIKINGDIDGIRETTYEEAKISYDNGKTVYTLNFYGKKTAIVLSLSGNPMECHFIKAQRNLILSLKTIY